MIEAYRTRELENAKQQHDAARQRMMSAKSKRAWREAEEDLNFWQGKVAYLTPPAIETFDAGQGRRVPEPHPKIAGENTCVIG